MVKDIQPSGDFKKIVKVIKVINLINLVKVKFFTNCLPCAFGS